MKHPAIEQQPEMASGSEIPWSAEQEKHLRRRMRNTWFEMWGILIAGLFFAALGISIHRWWPLPIAALLVMWAVALLYGLALVAEQLGSEMRRGARGEFFEGSGMLANKPRSTRGLTRWTKWPSTSFGRGMCNELAITCECGRVHQAEEWQWIPNYDPQQIVNAALFSETVDPGIDPGGGRYVILCPCGLGHFKLKQ